MFTRPVRSRTLWTRLVLVWGMALALTAFGASPSYAGPPANDEISNAVVVSELPFTDTVDTTEAMSEEEACGDYTVWYTFTPAVDGAYAFTTEGSDFDTVLGVYDGEPGSLKQLACNDDFDENFTSRLRLDLTAGTTYYISAGGCCEQSGTLVFNVYEAPPALELAVTLDKARLGTTPGTVVLSGTVTCSQDGGYSLSGSVRQRQGLNLVNAEFYADGDCSATPTTWTAIADAGSRVFLSKSATVTVNASACDGWSCDDTSMSRRIRIVKR